MQVRAEKGVALRPPLSSTLAAHPSICAVPSKQIAKVGHEDCVMRPRAAIVTATQDVLSSFPFPMTFQPTRSYFTTARLPCIHRMLCLPPRRYMTTAPNDAVSSSSATEDAASDFRLGSSTLRLISPAPLPGAETERSSTNAYTASYLKRFFREAAFGALHVYTRVGFYQQRAETCRTSRIGLAVLR